MTLPIDRRRLILTGSLGLGALAIPSIARGLRQPATGFTHAVASGEPDQSSVLLWTRYVPAGAGPVRLRAEVSASQDFRTIAGGGDVLTGPWRDHTAKLTVTGLRPGMRYFYRFVAPDGTRSPVGRTRTLGERPASMRIAIFSCSNMGFGWFNAYGHAAARDDLDLAWHLGDYIYEYGPGIYPSAADAVAGRDAAPSHEILALADYRLRYASYRSDPDLQALHRMHPMLVQWDDHESANDSWEGGAGNHDPAREGDWSVRKGAAMQAFDEWMPVSEQRWSHYEIPGLASLYRTDTRLAARSRPPEPTADLIADPRALATWRDTVWQDPAATMLGSTQEAWLAAHMASSARAGTPWQVVGFGTNLGQQTTPADFADLVSPSASAFLRDGVARRVAQGKAGLPANLDNWGGYPQARRRFLAQAQALASDTLVVSGDSHNAWAFDLNQDGRPAGVEFGGHSVNSSGIESATAGVDPARVAAMIVGANPELTWCDTSRRGYMALTLTPEAAINEWVFVRTVRARSAALDRPHRAVVRRGARRIA